MEVVRKVGTVAVRAAVVSEVVKEGKRAVVEVMEAAATVEAAMVAMVGAVVGSAAVGSEADGAVASEALADRAAVTVAEELEVGSVVVMAVEAKAAATEAVVIVEVARAAARAAAEMVEVQSTQVDEECHSAPPPKYPGRRPLASGCDS